MTKLKDGMDDLCWDRGAPRTFVGLVKVISLLLTKTLAKKSTLMTHCRARETNFLVRLVDGLHVGVEGAALGGLGRMLCREGMFKY